jgi:hypothetical protein
MIIPLIQHKTACRPAGGFLMILMILMIPMILMIIQSYEYSVL